MEYIYGATKGPHEYSKVISTIELNDFTQQLKTIGVIGNKYEIPNYLHFS